MMHQMRNCNGEEGKVCCVKWGWVERREGASSGKERAEGGIPVVVGWVEDGGKEQRGQ